MYYGGDGNIMHDNQSLFDKPRSTLSRVRNDSEEMASSLLSGMQDDCDQQQSEDALPTPPSDNNHGMEQI